MPQRYFDYTAAARHAGVSTMELKALCRMIVARQPGRMMREMHVYSLCRAIGKGALTMADALKPDSGELPPMSELRMGG